MSSSVWKKLFSQKSSQKKNSSVPSPKSQNEVQDMAKSKREIEQFRKLISKKITDPTLAKKAAQIIEDMLKEDQQQKPKKNKKAS